MKELDLLNGEIQRIEITSLTAEVEDLDKYLNTQLWTAVYNEIRVDQQIELWGFVSLGLQALLKNAS